MSTTIISALPALITSSSSVTAYTIDAASIHRSVHLSLNLCTLPQPASAGGDIYNSSDLNLFTAYTNASYTYGAFVQGGYANITVPATADGQDVQVALNLGLQGSDVDYTFELGVTTDSDDGDDPAQLPWHVLGRTPLFAFEDSDDTSALLTSPTYPSKLLASAPNYQVVVIPSSSIRDDLSNSSCYIRNLASSTGAIPEASINVTNTQRGVVELTVREGGTPGEADRGGTRLQYAVGGLDKGTNYTVWGLQNTTGLTAGSDTGSRLFVRQFFSTKSASNCRLLFDVSFCPDLAYSVPAPPDMSTSDLLDLYNQSLSPSLSAFNTTLSTFPCNDPVRKEQGMYSHVRTCDQCLDAYNSWLCAVRMPRCTDANVSPVSEDGNNPDNQITTFERTSANDSRTDFLPDSTFPYVELPPCIDVCQLVGASCPPLISSSFRCPLPGITLEQSYSSPWTKQIVFANVQGGDDPDYLYSTLEQQPGATRAKDRFGNVRCNDLGTLAITNRRQWSGSNVSGHAVRRVRFDASIPQVILVSTALLLMLGVQ